MGYGYSENNQLYLIVLYRDFQKHAYDGSGDGYLLGLCVYNGWRYAAFVAVGNTHSFYKHGRVDKGQYEGAQSIGMNHFQIMVKVVMPQVLRNILPAVSNEFVINIKDTSVLNVIGVAELFYQATVASKATFAIFETYAIVCVIYFVLTFTITRLLRLVERLLDGKKDYTICGSPSDSASMIKISEGETPND